MRLSVVRKWPRFQGKIIWCQWRGAREENSFILPSEIQHRFSTLLWIFLQFSIYYYLSMILWNAPNMVMSPKHCHLKVDSDI